MSLSSRLSVLASGKAAGSAAPLIWAQAQYLRLILDLQAGHLLDRPAITRDSYVTSGPPATVPLTISVTAPGAGATFFFTLGAADRQE